MGIWVRRFPSFHEIEVVEPGCQKRRLGDPSFDRPLVDPSGGDKIGGPGSDHPLEPPSTAGTSIVQFPTGKFAISAMCRPSPANELPLHVDKAAT